MNFNASLALLPHVLMAACGENKAKDDRPNSPPPASTPDISSVSDDPAIRWGRWAAACKPCGQKFCKDRLFLDQESLTWVETQYEDVRCEEPLMRIQYLASDEAQKGRMIARLVQTVVLIGDKDFQAVAEQTASCGYDVWPMHRDLNVTDKDCPKTPDGGGVWARWNTRGESIFRADYLFHEESLTLKTENGEMTFQYEPSLVIHTTQN